MCSILGILDLKSDPAALRTQALDLSRRMRHRGPDWSGVKGPHILSVAA